MSHIQPAAMLSVYVILIATMLATGCGSQPSRPQYYWDNASLNNLPKAQYDAQFRGHTAQCRAYAAGLANSAYPQRQQAPSYQTEYSGSIGGKPYYGSAQTTPTQQEGMGVGPLSGYLRAQRENERQQTLEDGYAGCMAEKGWHQVWQ